MRTYYIYKAENKINGKVYIGRSVDFFRRMSQHKKLSESNSSPLHQDFIKYGIWNFTWEILYIAEDVKEADEKEIYYIKKFNSIEPNGYNRTLGGTGGIPSDNKAILCFTLDGKLVKKYDSASQTEHDGFFIGGVLDCCKHKATRCHDNVFMYEDEYIEKGFIRKEKNLTACCKSIVQCDLNGNKIAEFNSVIEASRETECNRPNISGCLTGSQKSTGGYIFVYKEDYPIKNLHLYRPSKKGRKVAQIDKETGNIINIYNSVAEAGRAIGENYKPIHKVIDQDNKSAYGYKWKSL